MNIWFSVFDMVSNLPQYLYIMLNISKEYCEIHFSITHNIFSSFCMASPNDGREKGKRWPYMLHETLCQQQRRHCDPQWSWAGWQQRRTWHCHVSVYSWFNKSNDLNGVQIVLETHTLKFKTARFTEPFQTSQMLWNWGWLFQA